MNRGIILKYWICIIEINGHKLGRQQTNFVLILQYTLAAAADLERNIVAHINPLSYQFLASIRSTHRIETGYQRAERVAGQQ
jgi:hypothetical protein